MPLVRAKELPEWYTTYPYISHGYRGVLNPYDAFLSMFQWHNETLNIYKHLFTGFFYLWKLYTSSIKGTDEYWFLVNMAYFGATLMGISSGFAHTFSVVDKDWKINSWKFDFIGIISINYVHHLLDTFLLTKGLLESRMYCVIGFVLDSAFALFCVYRILVGEYIVGRYWGFIYPAVTCIPFTMPLYVYVRMIDSSDLIKDITQDSMNCSFFIIVSGVVFFKGHVPERFWNPYGIFNYLNSHVFHHVCCILSIIYGFKSLPKLSYID